MAKYLRMLRDGADVTAGKLYDVITESIVAYEIKDDANDSHTFYKTGEGGGGLKYTTKLPRPSSQPSALNSKLSRLKSRNSKRSSPRNRV